MTNVLPLFGPAPTAPARAAVGFDEFWRVYPRRVAKQEGLRAWAKLKPHEQAAALEALPAHCEVWADRADPRYIPHPATWLNGRRWEDELTPPGAAQSAADAALIKACGG